VFDSSDTNGDITASFGIIEQLCFITAPQMEEPKNTKKATYRNRQGAFFPYILKPEYTTPRMITQLQRCQVYANIDDVPNPIDNCFIYALSLLNAPEQLTNELKFILRGRDVRDEEIDVFAKQFTINIRIADVDDNGTLLKTRVYGVNSSESAPYKLCRYRMHYFINELTEYTKYYIQHIHTLPVDKYNHRQDRQRSYVAKDPKYYLTTSELIPLLYKQNCFRDMAYDEYAKFPQVRYQLPDDDDLHYTEGLSVKQFKMKNERKDNKNASIWFADFECTTDGDKHEPFIVCYSNEDGSEGGCHCGKDCGKSLLEDLPDGAIV
jgi:hypothetical protein